MGEKLFDPSETLFFLELTVKARHQQAGITGIVQLVQRMARTEVRPNQVPGQFKQRHLFLCGDARPTVISLQILADRTVERRAAGWQLHQSARTQAAHHLHQPGVDPRSPGATDLQGLQCRVHDPIARVHLCDRAKLRIVLQNLLSNAVKFTAQGSISVGVHPSDGGIEFCVADTGIGIAPEVRPVMFELFRQGDGSSTRRYDGAGLGLYVVRRMLELLGGTVEMESEAGRSSTFRVWIPQG